MIMDLTDHERVEGQFLLGSVSKGVNANGGSYLSFELRDASGQIIAKKWDATLEDEQLFVVGNVVNIIGETNKYKEQLQIKVLSAELVPLDEIDVAKFVKAPPVSKETLIKKFNDYVVYIFIDNNSYPPHPAQLSLHYLWSAHPLPRNDPEDPRYPLRKHPDPSPRALFIKIIYS